MSYTWTKLTPQAAGLVAQSPGRGQSTVAAASGARCAGTWCTWTPRATAGWRHWPMQDLAVALDDADGRIRDARFLPEEGPASTFAALAHILRIHGRFAELYTDRGSHFCHTAQAGGPPSTGGRRVGR